MCTGSTRLIELRRLAEAAEDERRREKEAKRAVKDLQEAATRQREKDAVADAEAERQRLEAAAQADRAHRLEKALHTPVGRWLKSEARFNDDQAGRFGLGLDDQGLSSTQVLCA